MELEVGKYYRTAGGEKVGPMAKRRKDGYGEFEVKDTSLIGGCVPIWHYDGFYNHAHPEHCIIAEWVDEPASPVRTATRKEIVPGVYGFVTVHSAAGRGVFLGFPSDTVAGLDELRAAIKTLTEIADALEETEQ